MLKAVSTFDRILLANSNQWYFNSLVKKPCHKTHCRCSHRLNLSFQSSRSCALPNIKVLKDKDLEFANSIRFLRQRPALPPHHVLNAWGIWVLTAHCVKHIRSPSLLPGLRMGMGQNCPKPPPVWAYQDKVTCACALRLPRELCVCLF